MKDRFADARSDNQRSTLGWLLVACLGSALAIAVAVALLIPPPNQDPSELALDLQAGESPPEATRASLSTTGAAPRVTEDGGAVAAASVIVPRVQVPATTEGLEAEARRVTEDLRSRYPDAPEALHVAAIMHAQLRESQPAQELWQQAVERAPEDERYSINLAAVAMERGDYALASDTLRRLIERGSTSEDVLHHFALSLTNLGQNDEAQVVLQQAVELYPQSSAQWMLLGRIQLKRGETEAAESSLKRALRLGAESAELYHQLATAARRLKKQDEAAEFQTLFEHLNKDADVAVEERFQVLSAAEIRNVAVATLIEAAAVNAKMGDVLRAESQLLRALALEPRSISACRSLADLYASQGMAANEVAVRERLTEMEPLRFENHLAMAQSAAQAGQWERAAASLKLALAQQPELPMAYAALAEFYLQARQGDQARWYAQEVVERSPSPEGYQFLAEACRMAGDAAAAEKADQVAQNLHRGGTASGGASAVPGELAR